MIRGKNVETEELPAYCAVALAGLDDLPDTIMTRSVVVRMRRRSPTEKVEPWRMRVNGPEAEVVREELRVWSASVGGDAMGAWPDMPAGVEDRDADVWEALLVVADLAGGEWPTRARDAAVTLVTASKDRTPSLGVTLLRDLRAVFGGRDRLTTDEILAALNGMEESPWPTIRRGDHLDARGLSTRLRKYGISPCQYRDGEIRARGYVAADLADAWERYLPPVGPDESVTAVTSVTPQVSASRVAESVTGVTDAVTDSDPGVTGTVTDASPPLTRHVTAVTGVTAKSGDTPDESTPSTDCVVCGETLIYADDLADGYHTSRRDCVEGARDRRSVS